MRTAARPIPEITPTVEAKLWANIDKRPDGIWAWKGSRPGKVIINYVPYYVNRVMWVWRQRQTNPSYQIPDGMFVCHTNDVTDEVYDCNPDNLWLGTALDNALDRERKGRGNHHLKLGNLNFARRHPETLVRGDRHPFRINPNLAARGEQHPASKLTLASVQEIRRLYATGRFRRKELGPMFGVSEHSIKAIVQRQSWRHDPLISWADKKQGTDMMSVPCEENHVTVGSPSSG